MPAFRALVERPGIRYVDQKDQGTILSCDAVCILTFAIEGGNPHELADEIARLRGKRVNIQVTLDQGEFDLTGSGEGDDDSGVVREQRDFPAAE